MASPITYALNADDGHHRTEGFFGIELHLRGDVIDHRGLHDGARGRTARNDSGALGNGIRQKTFNTRRSLAAHQGAENGTGDLRIARQERGCLVCKLAYKCVCDRRVDDDTLGGHANLSLVEK
jgi:hypothetical protein